MCTKNYNCLIMRDFVERIYLLITFSVSLLFNLINRNTTYASYVLEDIVEVVKFFISEFR